MEKLMGTGCISGQMETDMKENGKDVWNMEEGQTFLQMEISILENIIVVNHMVKVSICGLTVVIMKEILRMDLKMEKVNGKNILIRIQLILQKWILLHNSYFMKEII